MRIVGFVMSELTENQEAAVRGLRDLAGWLEKNPELIDLIGVERFYIFHSGSDVGEFARKALMLGPSQKTSIGDWYNVERSFGPMVKIQVTASHKDVCERVVVGTEEIEVEAPDPKLAEAALRDVPLVKTVQVIEKVEWKCPPSLMAAASTKGEGS